VPVERPVGPTDEAAVLVDRREGVRVVKVSTAERASRRVVRVVYRVEFEGHEPIEFDRLGAARERTAGPPPERPAASAEPSGTEAAAAVEGAGPPEAGTAEAAPRGPAQVPP
jgi:hypothetical protein